MSTLLLRETLAAHARGWTLTPLHGKRAFLEGWQKLPRQTEAQARRWAAEGNIGIRTGSASGILVIDVDPGGDVAALHLPRTWIVRTGRGGWHLYFRTNGRAFGNTVGKLAPHIDTRGDGGQIVAVGSRHPETGELYRWAPGRSPDDLPLADLPAHIAERLAPKIWPAVRPVLVPRVANRYAQAALEAEAAAVRNAPKEHGNHQLNISAFNLGTLVAAGLLDEADAIETLVAAATPRRSEHEARKTILSGLRAGKQAPRQLATAGAANGRNRV